MKKIIILLSLIILTSCGSSPASELVSTPKTKSMDYTEDYGNEASTMEASPSPEEAGGERGSNQSDNKIKGNRKLILRYSLNFDSKEYDKAVDFVEKLIRDYNGYQTFADESSGRERYSSITAMIPTDRVENFIADLNNEKSLNFLEKNLSSEDITDRYTDTELRLKVLRDKYQRLEKMAKEESTLEELLQLEKEITSTIYEIESIEGELRAMDTKVNYTEVYISISEITTEEPYTPTKIPFGEELSQAFSDSISNFIEGIQELILFIVYIIPYLLILAIVIVIIYFATKPLRKKLKERKEARMKEKIPKKPKEPYQNSAYKTEVDKDKDKDIDKDKDNDTTK